MCGGMKNWKPKRQGCWTSFLECPPTWWGAIWLIHKLSVETLWGFVWLVWNWDRKKRSKAIYTAGSFRIHASLWWDSRMQVRFSFCWDVIGKNDANSFSKLKASFSYQIGHSGPFSYMWEYEFWVHIFKKIMFSNIQSV